VGKTNPSITYTPRPDATPERERATLADAYRFLIDTHARKYPAAGPSERGNHDGTTKEASADVESIQEP
jgi:hypothetical protein